ncbi:hypothetical protein PENTCL1PPCAC_8421, partial [Pristionchus entomophagus]
VILFSCLLPAVLSTAFGSTSAVITSKDVKDGLTASKMPLKAGDKYRVYAVYAQSAPNDAYARGVVIRGADNRQFNVADLATPKAGTAYVLDENKILTAPITISDTHGGAGRVPYTIFMVAATIYKFDNSTIPVAPVISAQRAIGQVDCSVAKLSSASCTILSAERTFQISGIAVGSIFASVEVQVAGFDVASPSRYEDYTVMSVTKQSAASSWVNIPGPIATLHDPADTDVNFAFVLGKEAAWSGSLTPGASTTFLSNGFHDVGESYAMDYTNEDVRDRTYDFGKNTPVSFLGSVGNYYPDQGDTVMLSCIKAKGSASIYDLGDLAGQVQSDVCKTISFGAGIGERTPTGPRFIVQIES